MIINPYKVEEEKQDVVKHDVNVEKEICEEIISKNIDILTKQDKELLRKKIEEQLIYKFGKKDETHNNIINNIINKIYGYGILQQFISDENTTDIRVIDFQNIYIKQKGVWIKENISFESSEDLDTYIKFCALKNGSNINFETPVAIFSDRINRLRIEAGICPANINNSSLVIRIHKTNVQNTLEGLWLKEEMITKKQYMLLNKSVLSKKNIILCGQGGSGKTTLLRALINKLPTNTSITVNEETAELYLEGRNIIQRECILSRKEDKNIDLEMLAKHALVMSNDVIVIGEMKGKEANVFFDSIATGHMGLATLHSDSTTSTVNRIITLIKKDSKAQYYTEAFLNEYISKCVDLVVFLKNYKVEDISSLSYDKKVGSVIYGSVGE